MWGSQRCSPPWRFLPATSRPAGLRRWTPSKLCGTSSGVTNGLLSAGSDSAEFIGKALRVVELAQGFCDRACMYGDGAIHFIAVTKISNQRFDVAVEDEADDFRIAVDYRGA